MPALEATAPKTTGPCANSQRKKEHLTADRLNKKLDAFPDKVDVRNWFYHPNLQALPEQVIMSNAFEGVRGTPLLGMEKFINGKNSKLDQTLVDDEVAAMLNKKINGRESLVIAGAARADKLRGDDVCRSETHGGFDNDPFTLNSVLFRILGDDPDREFEMRDLQW